MTDKELNDRFDRIESKVGNIPLPPGHFWIIVMLIIILLS